MANKVESTGKTVEEAVKLALLELNATLDEVDIKILDSGTPGHILGLGAREAHVRIVRRDSPYSEDQDDAQARFSSTTNELPGQGASTDSGQEPHKDEGETDSAVAPDLVHGADNEERSDSSRDEGEIEIADIARTSQGLIEGLISRMGFDANVEQTSVDPVSFNILGRNPEDLDPLIGPNGETLRALGFLVNSMLGRMVRSSVRIVVDVDGYRKRREEDLFEFAREIADEVRDTNESITLEAMPAHERRMIHMAIADLDDIRTYSIGEGRERRVVVGPAL